MTLNHEEKVLFKVLKQNDKLRINALFNEGKFEHLTPAEKIDIANIVIENLTERSLIESITYIFGEFLGNPTIKTKDERIEEINYALNEAIPNINAKKHWKNATKIISKAIHSKGFHPIDTVRLAINSDKYLTELSQSIYDNIPVLKLNHNERKKYELQYNGNTLELNNKTADTSGQFSKGVRDYQAFVMSKTGQLYIGEHSDNQLYEETGKQLMHGSFLEDEPAEMAGMISIKNGKITSLTNHSGHYTPKALDLYRGIKILQKKIPNVFDQNCIISIFDGNDAKKLKLKNFIIYMEQKTPNGKELHEAIRDKRLDSYKKYKTILMQKTSEDKKNQISEIKYEIEHEDDNEGTKLHRAVNNNDNEQVEFLINHNLESINQKNILGYTALHGACGRGQIDIAKIIINGGANVNEKTFDGETALHLACIRARPNLATELINHGANIDEEDNYGETALHYICKSSSNDKDIKVIIIELLKAGINVNKKNRFGKTGLDYASSDIKEFINETNAANITNLKNISSIPESNTRISVPGSKTNKACRSSSK